MSKRILFVTGTDTGVGKTILSAMLVRHLRQNGVHALAMKPFCSGGMEDVKLLSAAQDAELTAGEINPFYFKKPLAPAAAGEKRISLTRAIDSVRTIQERCEWLVVEGSGGLLVPLGRNYFVVDLIVALKSDVVIVSRNKLGTINHTLLSCECLLRHGADKKPAVVLMGQGKKDCSSKTNAAMLRRYLPVDMQLISFPYLGPAVDRIAAINRNCIRFKKVLASIVPTA